MPDNLADPPWRVLAKTPAQGTRWCRYAGFDGWGHLFRPEDSHLERAQDLRVIKHPRNDKEALAIIQKAKERT